MSFTIHPFCENGSSVPRNCVHAGPVSLGLLPKDYKADTAQLWRAGINPSTNLLVASTTFSRGLVGSAATSTPRYWWISGPLFDQATLEMKVKEVVGRLPERAPDNYVPFSDYATAYEWAKTNGYALINCNYPDYRLGDFNSDTRSLINIESGFLPSFDGSQYKLRNLANPTASVGFGTANPKAVPHDSTIAIQSPGVLGTPCNGIGTESGVTLLIGSHISQLTNPIQNGITNGIIFEGIMNVPDGAGASYTLLQARDSADTELMSLNWITGGGPGGGWQIRFTVGPVVYNEISPSPPLSPGQYYFCVAIPTTQSGGTPVHLYISSKGPSTPIILQEQIGGQSWSVADVKFSFGSTYSGGVGSRNVSRFYSAKVHNLVSPWDSSSADSFWTQNWPVVQSFYSSSILP
jgi:hypothetical protein